MSISKDEAERARLMGEFKYRMDTLRGSIRV
jgi:hypothetical protein